VSNDENERPFLALNSTLVEETAASLWLSKPKESKKCNVFSLLPCD
jgi:hypothetical protein